MKFDTMNDSNQGVENSEKFGSRQEKKDPRGRSATLNNGDSGSESTDERHSNESKYGHSDEDDQTNANAAADESSDGPRRLENFNIQPKTVKLLKKNGITELFPIQAETFDEIFRGEDLIGRDRTGTGKTLAYALPLIERMRNNFLFEFKRGQTPLILVLAPTRELAIQVSNGFKSLKHEDKRDFRICSVYGGTDAYPQISALKSGVEVVVGTPGRILDLLEREVLKFHNLQAVVLDEVDQMLDFGFQEDMDKLFQDYIYTHTKKETVQTILFSATVPEWVKQVSQKYLKPDFKFVDLIKDKEIKTPANLKHLAVYCPDDDVISNLGNIITTYAGGKGRAIIFCERKADANAILGSSSMAEQCMVLHGDISQGQRERTLKAFRDGEFPCLVATDVAARGLDIPEVDLILQLEPPRDIESYIHRSGRTARAGRSGVSITIYNEFNRENLLRIEKEAKIKISRVPLPQSHDLIKSKTQGIMEEFEEVAPEVLPLFENFAQKLTEKYGEKEALSRALSIISGHTSPTQERSLLSSKLGYVAYVLEAKEGMTRAEAAEYLKEILSKKTIRAIESIRSLPEGNSVAFDIPKSSEQEILEYIEQNIEHERFTLKKAEELPFMKGDDSLSGSRRRNGYGQGSQRSGNWRDNKVSDARERNAYGRNKKHSYDGDRYDRRSERSGGKYRRDGQDYDNNYRRRYDDRDEDYRDNFSGPTSQFGNEGKTPRFFVRNDGSLALDYSYQPLNVLSSVVAMTMKDHWLTKNVGKLISKVKKFL